MPIDYKAYPSNWFTDIRPAVLKRAQSRGVGSPAYPDCRAVNYQPHPVTGSKVILTIAHLEHDPTNSSLTNLRAWQRCHLTYDATFHAQNAYSTRRRGKAHKDLFDEEPPSQSQAAGAPR